jgi:ATP synthase F1 delta subunit
MLYGFKFHRLVINQLFLPLLISLPGRYARALFLSLPAEEKPVALDYLCQLSHYTKEYPREMKHLSYALSRNLEPAKVADILKLLSSWSNKFESFIKLLGKNKRLHLLPEIYAIYSKLLAFEQGTMKVSVAASSSLDKSAKAKICRLLENATNLTPLAEFTEDPKLLGGLRIELENHLLDLSLAHQLKTVATLLKGNENL